MWKRNARRSAYPEIQLSLTPSDLDILLGRCDLIRRLIPPSREFHHASTSWRGGSVRIRVTLYPHISTRAPNIQKHRSWSMTSDQQDTKTPTRRKVRRRPPQVVRVLATPSFSRLLASQALFDIGAVARTVVQSWVMYDLTGSNLWVGLVSRRPRASRPCPADFFRRGR